ncbi:MAG: cyclic nucleotide-binding domain-containing protein [Chloroflexi bacterium]|nr:cyclic nucleotide-binding domain-containing protein [Chloroflexota bacterium]
MLDTLRQIPLFAQLLDDQLQWVAEHTREVRLAPGELLFSEGDTVKYFHILLTGEVQVTKRIGGLETILTTHHDGAFTGEVPLLTGTPHIATARALRQSHLLRMEEKDFRKMLSACPPVMSTILSALAQRVQTTESLVQQREKMVALGTLAAGLAHELNNPAAAANRAAEQLRATFQTLQALSWQLNELHLSPAQRQYLANLQQQVVKQAATPPQLDALEQSDREEEITDWLDRQGVADGWQLASTFVRAGLDIEMLEDCADHVPADALGTVLAWLEATLTIQGLSEEIEHGTRRISVLVKAVKEYSYMDQAPLQEIDIHEGLESTLIILGHKLKQGIVVTREYDRSLPRICAYGSELNQVWTNLLDNAIDALNGQGEIRVHTSRENDHILVEIADNGPGIPVEIQHRIFEPFFTTKDVGKGTGLGLDISYRIIRRHHGDIRVISIPGDTRFQIRLPIDIEQK